MARKSNESQSNENKDISLQFSYEPEGTNLLGQDKPENIKTTSSKCTHGLKGVLNVGVKEVKSDKNISDMQDIDINKETLKEGDLLIYDETDKKWKNKQFEEYYSGIILDGNVDF